MVAGQETGAGAGVAFAVILGGILAGLGLAVLAAVFALPMAWIIIGALVLSVIGYGAVAVASRSRLVTDHLVAGRSVPPGLNGLATTAQWLTGAGFFGLAALLYHQGHDGLAFILGWSAGFLLLGVLFAPYLHKSGALTVPDFLGLRYGGVMPRLLGVLVLIAVSAGVMVAGLQVIATVAERASGEATGLGYGAAVWIAVAVALLCTLPGGMISVTWTQVAQGLVALIAFLVPAVWMSASLTGMPLPQIALGEVLGGVTNAEAAIGLAPAHAEAFTGPGPADSPRDFLALAFCVMLGTAVMPVLLQRFLTTPTVRAARASAGWSLVFVTLVLITVPAYAVFARFEILSLFAGGGGTLPYDAIPGWMLGWSGDILRICGVAATDATIVQGACGADKTGIAYADIAFAPEFLILAVPGMAGMPPVVTVLIVAGGVAAALSSVTGLALAMANTLSHDVGYRLMGPDMTPRQRVTLGKIMMAIVLIGGGLYAREPVLDAGGTVALTFSLAGSGLFAALLLGIWDRRTTGPGAAAGMVTGFGLVLVYVAGAAFGGDGVRGSGDEVLWFGIPPVAAGVFGVPASLLVTWAVSRLTPAPSDDVADFVEEMRVPRDHAIAAPR